MGNASTIAMMNALINSIRAANPGMNDTRVRSEAWLQLYSQRDGAIINLNGIYNEMLLKKNEYGMPELWETYYKIWAWETLYYRSNDDDRLRMNDFINRLYPDNTRAQKEEGAWRFYVDEVNAAMANAIYEGNSLWLIFSDPTKTEIGKRLK